ncbi:MAG: HAD-IA family hydrolase [Clostridia bacterium]|nr:HAD-IA family hydrolase [Clostridia bacterium]
MNNFKYILFDLDGTLTEPALGITNSVKYALKKFGIEAERRELYKFIGPPLVDSFMEFYGFDYEKAMKALEYYREYFSVKGIFENSIFDGVEEMLKNLKANGKKVILATSKPEKYAIQILEHFKIEKYFDFVAGATMDEKRNRKEDVIEYAISEFGVKDTEKAVMVGDRKYDIEGAHAFNLKAVGVLFGYGSAEELADADYQAEDIDTLSKILL